MCRTALVFRKSEYDTFKSKAFLFTSTSFQFPIAFSFMTFSHTPFSLLLLMTLHFIFVSFHKHVSITYHPSYTEDSLISVKTFLTSLVSSESKKPKTIQPHTTASIFKQENNVFKTDNKFSKKFSMCINKRERDKDDK